MGSHAVIFVIDIFDNTKFHDVKQEIDTLVVHEHIKNCVILILFNKKDKFSKKIPENEVWLKIKISNRTLQ